MWLLWATVAPSRGGVLGSSEEHSIPGHEEAGLFTYPLLPAIDRELLPELLTPSTSLAATESPPAKSGRCLQLETRESAVTPMLRAQGIWARRQQHPYMS